MRNSALRQESDQEGSTEVDTESTARSRELSAHTALLDLAPDAIFARDAERRITFWNRGAQSTYGFSPAEALGVSPADLLHTEYPLALEEIERLVMEMGGWEGDLVQHTKDGRRLVVESRWAAQQDEAGQLVGILEVNRDITGRVTAGRERERLEAEAERERLQNQLHQAQRLESLGQLAGGIAHDFNNLLAVIINYAAFVAEDLAAASAKDGEERWRSTRDDVEQICLAGERASHLTHQLLAFARREVVQPEVVNVNDVVREIEQLLLRTLGEHVELQSSLAEGLYPVLIDPGQVEQILVNFAVNARDAMPDGGALRIDTANMDLADEYASSRPELSPGPHVRLMVSDTGVGMPPETVQRAFDPFFTTKPAGQGTGLGLATVYGIIQQAGGRCQIYSEPGIGTTITVLLPATAQTIAPAGPAVESLARRCEETILLVEDEDALREVTRRILIAAGYKVIVATNGLDALRVAEAHGARIDILLSDVVMPQMNGPQLAEQLLLLRPSIRVLLMSGFAQPILDSGGHLGDGIALIEKPFSGPALLAEVGQILSARRLASATAADR
jgi:two-component system, cell cycle sensor histidine kinase and response regulator CckA